MMEARMLAPAAVLVLWSLVMMLWMMVTRFSAFGKSKIDLTKSKPGGRGVNLEGVLPDEVNWKAHNYAHLMEQPTIFYPTVVILALTHFTGADVALAWGYVAIRIVHSIWQATKNVVMIRFYLFLASSLCLVALAARAVMATLVAAPTVLA